MKTVAEGHVGAEKERDQKQGNTNKNQKEKPMVQEINREENASFL